MRLPSEQRKYIRWWTWIMATGLDDWQIHLAIIGKSANRYKSFSYFTAGIGILTAKESGSKPNRQFGLTFEDEVQENSDYYISHCWMHQFSGAAFFICAGCSI